METQTFKVTIEPTDSGFPESGPAFTWSIDKVDEDGNAYYLESGFVGVKTTNGEDVDPFFDNEGRSVTFEDAQTTRDRALNDVQVFFDRYQMYAETYVVSLPVGTLK